MFSKQSWQAYLSATAANLHRENRSMPKTLPSTRVKNPLVLPRVVPLATLVYAKAATNDQFATNHITANSIESTTVSLIESGGSSDAWTSASLCDRVEFSLCEGAASSLCLINACVSGSRATLFLRGLTGRSVAGRRPSIDEGRRRIAGRRVSAVCDGRPARIGITSDVCGKQNPSLDHQDSVCSRPDPCRINTKKGMRYNVKDAVHRYVMANGFS